jgi:hypothetical protein
MEECKMTFISKISIASFVCVFGFAHFAYAEVTQTSGTGADFARECKKAKNACALTGSGGGIDTYSACTSSQCYTVSCSSEQPGRNCIKEESPSARVGTGNRQTVRRLLGASVVQNNTGNSSNSGNAQGANTASGDNNVGSAAPTGPTKGSGGGCSGGVC